jgi:antitoxin component of MazEF toxin-antitoxin module
MKRKIVQTGGSLAVTLPQEVVETFKLKKGQEVDVTVHPTTAAITVRLGIGHFDNGRVSRRFRQVADAVMERYADAFAELAK